MPCVEMLPRFVAMFGKLVFATLQFTGTIAPVEAVAVQLIRLPEETIVATTEFASTQVTVWIAVGRTSVKFCVVVKVDHAVSFIFVAAWAQYTARLK